MKIYTIGFTQKSAEEFYDLLQKNKIEKVVDITPLRDSSLLLPRFGDLHAPL